MFIYRENDPNMIFIPHQTVDRPKDWYKTMFKQIHKVHKAGRSLWTLFYLDSVMENVHACRACLCLCVCACLFACQFLLRPKCQNRSKPELIRWEHEMVERRKNWVKPLIDSELSWEICSHFVGSAESHRLTRLVCSELLRLLPAWSHTRTHALVMALGWMKHFLMPDQRKLPLEKENEVF